MNKLKAYQDFKKNYVAASCAVTDYLLLPYLYDHAYSHREWAEYNRVFNLVAESNQNAREYLNAGGRRPLSKYLRELNGFFDQACRKHHQVMIRHAKVETP